MAAIPNAGAMTVLTTPGWPDTGPWNRSASPPTCSRTWAEADDILNYERWSFSGYHSEATGSAFRWRA